MICTPNTGHPVLGVYIKTEKQKLPHKNTAVSYTHLDVYKRQELTGQRKEEAEDDDLDWDEEVLGEMEGGEPNDRFSSYWDDDTEMTYPLILAKIPVKNPWEIFAYLPFGNWNDCPDTPELMAAAKYWFQQHGAIPAAMSHDELEFELPTPISKERAMEVAVEQYGFCPDLDQNEDGSIGSLADVLWQSTVWYFWWD